MLYISSLSDGVVIKDSESGLTSTAGSVDMRMVIGYVDEHTMCEVGAGLLELLGYVESVSFGVTVAARRWNVSHIRVSDRRIVKSGYGNIVFGFEFERVRSLLDVVTYASLDDSFEEHLRSGELVVMAGTSYLTVKFCEGCFEQVMRIVMGYRDTDLFKSKLDKYGL